MPNGDRHRSEPMCAPAEPAPWRLCDEATPLDDPAVAATARLVWSAVAASPRRLPDGQVAAVAEQILAELAARPDAARAVLRGLTDEELHTLLNVASPASVGRALAAATDARRYALSSSRDVLARVARSSGAVTRPR